MAEKGKRRSWLPEFVNSKPQADPPEHIKDEVILKPCGSSARHRAPSVSVRLQFS
jgi:hypothetical protein